MTWTPSPAAAVRPTTSSAPARPGSGPDGAAYQGPDGQQALFPRRGAGYRRVLGLHAHMRWFDGRRWSFASAGRPVSADRLALGHREGRLSRLGHAGGRSITVRWTMTGSRGGNIIIKVNRRSGEATIVATIPR